MPGKIKIRCIESPFGQYAFVSVDDRICAAGFVDDDVTFIARIKKKMSDMLVEQKDVVENMSGITLQSLVGPYEQSDKLVLEGTDFQTSVWKALLRIPLGKCVSYSNVAAMINRPSAVRAVASAIAKNPIAVLVPCHRVIKSSGDIGEYRWGRARKKAILDWEKCDKIIK
jgi:AraC family transcriptional regulator, regulatory protein of adaptative response / methylated-DNA-[protein]-cysteine methyltransferase